MIDKDGVVIIGLDGATFDLLLPLVEAGLMPALKSLLDTGAHGVLNSTIPPVTGPAWSTFHTGTNPGKHGVVDFQIYQPGTYQTQLLDASKVQMKTIWEIASSHGLRVCAINVPVTYPPREVNGYLISGFLTPGPHVAFTYPADLREALLERFPNYVIAPQVNAGAVSLRQYVETMIGVIQQRLDAALWLMEQESWDLFMVHFQAVDLLQHAFWDHLDPRHPAYHTHSETDRTIVRGFYQALDSVLAKLIDERNGGSTIVISDHGFGPADKRVYLNRWLHDCGLLGLRSSDARMGLQALAEDTVRKLDVLKLRHHLLPKDFKRERGALIRKWTQDPWIDWTKTRAYMLSGSSYPNLFINQMGRELEGTVAEADYESVRDAVALCLSDLVDPETSRPVIETVYKKEEVYRGQALPVLPDLVASQNGGYLFETRFKGSAVFGSLPASITGLHRMEGILVLSGGAFDARRESILSDMYIMDIAPTVLHMLGIPAAEWMDGRVLHDIFSETFQPPARATINLDKNDQGSKPSNGDTGGQTTAENVSLVEERLRNLGYL